MRDPATAVDPLNRRSAQGDFRDAVLIEHYDPISYFLFRARTKFFPPIPWYAVINCPFQDEN